MLSPGHVLLPPFEFALINDLALATSHVYYTTYDLVDRRTKAGSAKRPGTKRKVRHSSLLLLNSITRPGLCSRVHFCCYLLSPR